VRENGGVTGTGRSRRLSGDEVALVLRRAAQIDAADEIDGSAGYEPAAIEEAARDVGLSPAAVRQAVAELRAGALPDEATDRDRGRGRAVAGSRVVAEQRLVTSHPDRVHATVDRFMRTQMLELRRRSGDRALYRQRSDMVASLRRGLDFGGAIKLEGLRTIDVVVTPADERTLVRIEAELASSRANAVAGGAAAGTAVAVTTGLAGALLAEPVLVVGALPLGVAVGGGGVRVAGARWRQRRDDVAEVLASLLDRL
jgi:hypothetical protein